VRFGVYEALETLGRGGTSLVYRARAPGGGEVAVKQLTRIDAAARARFERERRLLASLGEAEGFVPILDQGETTEGPFLVMPLLRGGTLRDRIDRGPLPLAEAVSLVGEVARSMQRAHALGIVHRDLKPENVMLDGRGRPLVADLGLARHFVSAGSVAISKSSELLGTAGYMSPEQMRDPRTVGPQADVFALGAILYECLAGRMAFAGGTVLEMLGRAESGTVAPLPRSVPAHVALAVERALASDLSVRHRDAGELAKALLAPSARKTPRAIVAVALLLFASSAGLGIVLASRSESSKPGPVSPKPGPAHTEEILSLDPGSVPGRLVRARARRKSDGPGALADLDFVLATAVEKTTRDEALLLRSSVRLETGDREGALADARELVRVSESPDTLLNLGQVAYQCGNDDDAIAAAVRAVALDPKKGWAFGKLSLYYREAHDLTRSLEAAERYVALDARNPDAHSVLASARLASNDLDGAIASAEESLSFDPKWVFALQTRAEARRRQGDLRGALADADRAIELDPNSGWTWGTRAQIQAFLKEYDLAIHDATRAIELEPGTATHWLFRAVAHAQKNELAPAEEDATKALALGPRLWAALDLRAQVRRLGGNLDGAKADEAVLLEAWRNAPQDPELEALAKRIQALR